MLSNPAASTHATLWRTSSICRHRMRNNTNIPTVCERVPPHEAHNSQHPACIALGATQHKYLRLTVVKRRPILTRGKASQCCARAGNCGACKTLRRPGTS